MSDHIYYFAGSHGSTAVALPYDLDAIITAWHTLRRTMIHRKDAAFTREEWAYLVTFLSDDNLRRPFAQSFGEPVHQPVGSVTRLARPRGPVAIWLPNNVSLLGPLTLILLTLTGNRIILKGGSSSEDLTGAFLAYVRKHDNTGILRDYLGTYVQFDVFGRDDRRNSAMAAEASLRIVFGSDAAAQSIHSLPHPLESIGFSNADRRSEVWIDADTASDDVLTALIRVFAIYGQTGCTSPSRVVLLEQSLEAAVSVRDRLRDLWPTAGPRDVPLHLASANIMARQWASGSGWDAVLTSRNQAVLAVGDYTFPAISSPMVLPIVAAPATEAAANLPANIQTLGHAVADPYNGRWMRLLANSRVKRFVPIRQMHHFGPLWDGEAYWMQAFELVQVESEV